MHVGRAVLVEVGKAPDRKIEPHRADVEGRRDLVVDDVVELELPARPSSRAAFVRHKGEKSGEEHYEEAAGRNAYSVARCASAYHGCMLEASRALNAARSDKAAA